MQQGGVACKAEGDYGVFLAFFLHSPPSASRHLHLAREGRSLIHWCRFEYSCFLVLGVAIGHSLFLCNFL